MSTERWVDCSYDPLTREEASKLKAAVVKGVVQCLWADGREQPANRIISLRNALLEGLDVAAYIVITPRLSGIEHVKMGRQGVPQDIWDALKFVAIDVEVSGLTSFTIRDAVEAAVALGKSRVIYTSYNAWANKLPNFQSFADCRLWNAYWDLAPDIDFASLPFGGWTIQQVLGEQWSGGTYVEGQFVDRNEFVTELLRPAPVEEVVVGVPLVDPCGLVKMRVQELEECGVALAKGDRATLVRWAKYVGSA